MVAPRADALTDRTTTYSKKSAVSDPSELGSEPDSWLDSSRLRAHERSGWCVREQRLGSHAPNRQRSTASRRKTHKTVPQLKTGALVAPRVDALTDRITTYRYWTAVSDPSELGSDPDSCLYSRFLRAHDTIGVVRA